MTIWPPRKGTLTRPLYRSLAQSLTDAVAAGELEPGTKLPTHRHLAFTLSVSIQTVTRAYEELQRAGIISGEVGRGSFVRPLPSESRTHWHPATHGDDVIDLSTLTPVLGTIHGRRMAATLAELAGKIPQAALRSFGPSAALEPHAETAVGWLLRCGLRTRRELILPTNGNTSAMTVALMTAVSPGDIVVTEEVGHQALKMLAGPLGLRLHGLEVDEEGVTPDAFARACRREPVKVLYVMPSGLAPMAHDMGMKRREELCGIAETYDVTIIENDAWGPLRTARPAPMAAIAPERTLYFTGLTKCLLPSLRIAWLVMPETMAATARARHLASSWMATALMAEIATRWLRNGTATELLRWQRAALERRNAIAARALRGLSVRATPKGMHVWLRLPDPWREDQFAADARRHGVAVAAGAVFAMEETERHQQGLRICLGGVGEAKLRRGLDVIAALARQTPALPTRRPTSLHIVMGQ